MEKISNEFLSLCVSEQGAEIKELTRLSDNRQYIWEADPKFWDRSSPILFPAVGGLWNGEARFNGKVYHTPRHGFIRDVRFNVKEKTASSVTLEHNATEEQLKLYPFQYHFEVTYSLEGRTLNVVFKIQNCDARTMWFQIGGHPGFRLPDFDPANEVHGYARLEGDVESILHTGEQNCLIPGHFDPPVLENNGMLALKSHTTGDSGLIFDHSQLRGVTLFDKHNQPFLHLSSEAPAFLLWAPAEAPFICIEPWFGLCDYAGFEGDYSMRPYVNEAKPGQTWQGGFRVEIF